MSASLEPGQVEPGDIKFWLIETVALFRRKTLWFIALSLGYFFIASQLQMLSLLTFWAAIATCLLTAALSIFIAACADQTQSVSLFACYQMLKNTVVVIVAMAVMYTLIWVIAARLAALLPLDALPAGQPEEPVRGWLAWLYPGTIGFLVAYIGTMITTMWFLLPLSVFHRLGLVDAVKLAKLGERRNFFVVIAASYLPFFAFFVLFLLTDLGLLIAVPGLPLYGIYLFVAYRHVYLGRRDNAPAVIAREVAIQRPV